MIKVYAISVVLGVLALVVVIFGGAIAANVGRAGREPGAAIGLLGRIVVGCVLGFGMGGLSAEFSTMDLSWASSLVFALLGAALGGLWAWWATRDGSGEQGSDAGPV
ncbi:MAG: hypothetical protein WA726_06425 [Acidimicrobiia bacterium]